MKDIIQKKLNLYKSEGNKNFLTEQDEENALKEITQELCLYSLAKNNFFEKATFQGGTCLRIVHGLDRFSEDLDFVLHHPLKKFDLDHYLQLSSVYMKAYGYDLQISGADKDQENKNIKKRFLKDDSIKKILFFHHQHDLRKKINIKIELDINPPEHSISEVKFLDFPTDYSIMSHDMSSLFAGKLHALICRTFVKGRDWYDFNWYLSQKTKINYNFLKAALIQQGPFKNQSLKIDQSWIQLKLKEKISTIDWKKTIQDVAPFLNPQRKNEIINLWSEEFFLSKLSKLPKDQ
jgi:predicted nucleotidyltransferase component of viral defense system